MATKIAASLSCTICGGANPPTARAQDEGWFLCRYCDSVAALPGAGVVVTEGPGGRLAEVTRPGATEIIVRGGGLAETGSWLPVVLLGDLVTGSFLAALRRGAPWVGFPLSILIWTALIGVGAYRRFLEMSEQHLRIADTGELTLWRQVGRWRFREQKTSLLLLKARHDSDGNRSYLTLSRNDAEVARVRCAAVGDATWIVPRLRTAARLTHGVSPGRLLGCEGCGGPLGAEKELRDRGSLTCPHCGNGLVYTHGGMHLDALKLGRGPGLESCDPDRAVTRETADGIEIDVPGFRGMGQVGFAFVLAPVGLGIAALAVWGIVLLVPYLRLFPLIVSAAIALCGLIAVVFAGGTVSQFVTRRAFRVTDTVFEFRETIAGRVYRRQSFPISRLVKLEASVVDEQVKLDIESATHSGSVHVYRAQDATAAALPRLYEVLQERAGGLRRSVRQKGRQAAEVVPS